MGFGIAFLIIIFVIIPLTIILFIIWLVNKKKIFAQAIGCLWLPIFSLVLLLVILNIFTKKMELDKDDVYGEYIIDRTKFPGKQADWQYNHYRFEITENKKFLFHLTEKNGIKKTYKGRIEFLRAYEHPRIVLHFEKPTYHIIEDNPTLYRNVWLFYYVFHSDKFGNVFFKKGKWKPIE